VGASERARERGSDDLVQSDWLAVTFDPKMAFDRNSLSTLTTKYCRSRSKINRKDIYTSDHVAAQLIGPQRHPIVFAADDALDGVDDRLIPAKMQLDPEGVSALSGRSWTSPPDSPFLLHIDRTLSLSLSVSVSLSLSLTLSLFLYLFMSLSCLGLCFHPGRSQTLSVCLQVCLSVSPLSLEAVSLPTLPPCLLLQLCLHRCAVSLAQGKRLMT